MEQISEFIKPELLILIPISYFVGMGLKKSNVKDAFIPAILGACGVLLAGLYVCGTEGFSMFSVFTAITQGILCAGASVYINQLVKQKGK